MITITIHPFGHMREFFDTALELSIEDGAQKTLRDALTARFPDAGHLMELCAFSTNEQILAEHEEIQAGMHISILPPVCGG